MKRTTTLLIAALIAFPAITFAQTRGRTTTRPLSRTAKSSPTSAAQYQGAKRISDQIKTLSRFLYVLGGVAKGIEAVDEAARRNEASPEILEQAKRNKLSVRTSIKSVREGLDALEIEFRTTPALQRYYTRLAGSAAGAATAEDHAAANQFEQAGRSLLGVVNRLTDVLLEMR